MEQLDKIFGKEYAESWRKLEEQHTKAIKQLQYWNRVALTKLEKFNNKVATSKQNDGDQPLDLDDKSTQQNASIWNDFLASCKKNKSHDIDDNHKPVKQSTGDTKAETKAWAWLYSP